MKTIDEMIAVMTAYKEGKTIECKFNFVFNDKAPWEICPEPVWNWDGVDYRVKSEPKYRPYANAEESFKDVVKHGGWIKSIETGIMYSPYRINDGNISFQCGLVMEWLDLSCRFVWADDGSPVGVLVEE